MKEITEGNKDAFRVLYDHHHQKVYSFAFFITRSNDLAEEITQEVFIRIWTNRQKLPSIFNFTAWIKTIVRNLSYTYLHRIAVERTALQQIMKNSSEAESMNQDGDFDKLIDQAIDHLPEQQKKVIQLTRDDSMKQKVIARQLGISLHTVKNHKKAALQSIRIFLERNTDAITILVIFVLF